MINESTAVDRFERHLANGMDAKDAFIIAATVLSDQQGEYMAPDSMAELKALVEAYWAKSDRRNEEIEREFERGFSEIMKRIA